MSACVTSFSLIATMPLNSGCGYGFGHAGVTSLIRQSAISSASSSALDRRHRRLDVDDDAFLEPARRLRPETTMLSPRPAALRRRSP
jgi:hypothetical protein